MASMADKKIKLKKAQALLQKGIVDNNPDLVLQAIAGGADVNAGLPKLWNWEPLWYCVDRKRDERIIAALVDAGAKYSVTYMMQALENGDDVAAQFFLKKNVDLARYRNNDGYTALHCAAHIGRGDWVGRLLKAGCDPCVLDKQLRTPADVAKKQGHMQIAESLWRAMPVDKRPKAAKKEFNDVAEGWTQAGPRELCHVSTLHDSGYIRTEFFDFATGSYTRIMRNAVTQAESMIMRDFEELREELLAPAVREMEERGIAFDCAIFAVDLNKRGIKAPANGVKAP